MCIRDRVNPLLSLLAALFISLVAGWLLSLGEPGNFLAEEVLFPLGLFYLKLLFLFSMPLLSGALICLSLIHICFVEMGESIWNLLNCMP